MLNPKSTSSHRLQSTHASLPLPRTPGPEGSARVAQMLARALLTKLRITEDHLVAELFSGSGELARALAVEAGLRHQIVAIDPSPRPDLGRQACGEIRPVQMEPWEFARYPICYDRILLKDALHRIEDPARFVAEARARLMPRGSLAVVLTVPDPGFELDLLEGMGCPTATAVDSAAAAAMLQRGRYRVRRSHAQLARRMTWTDYLQLLRSRHLPALSCLSDAQLQARIDGLLPQRPAGEWITMTHHFDIVSGSCED